VLKKVRTIDKNTVRAVETLTLIRIPNKLEAILQTYANRTIEIDPDVPEIKISLPILFLRIKALSGMALNIKIGPINAIAR